MGASAIINEDFGKISLLPLPWAKLRGARIFCTGATGFVGSYLATMLSKLGSEKDLNLNLKLFRRAGSLTKVSIPGIHWIDGDITGEFLPHDFAPDIIIHAASPANTQAYAKNPEGLFQTNILATHYLLDQARKNGSTFIYFSSAAVYQNQHGRLSEAAPGALMENGARFTVYAASKLGGELLCQDYREKYGVDCRVIRPFNIHGPGESFKHGRFFPDLIRQALEKTEIVVMGSGSPVRDSCYIMDFVSGLMYILLNGKSAIYNIGNEENTYTILELAQQIAEQSGKIEVVGPLCATLHTAGDSLVPDTTKLRQLGWRPQVNLQECIRRCMNSYQ